MKYCQIMTDLVFDIRAHLSPADKQTIKKSNPELLEELAEIYSTTDNTLLRSLIEDLMALAGTTWLALLTPPLPNHYAPLGRGAFA
jgi:hypothetical protein